MFAFMVPLQLAPLVGELVVPKVLGWALRKWKGPGYYGSKISEAKDTSEDSKKELAFMQRVAHEVSLPAHRPFGASECDVVSLCPGWITDLVQMII